MNDFFIHKRDDVLLDKSVEVLASKIIELPANGTWKVRFDSYDKRSNPMNRYLHGVLIPEFRKALNGAGYMVLNDVQAKEICKNMFLKSYIVNDQTGQAIEYVKRTRDLTKEEMTKLFDDVIIFCSTELNYTILYPSEQSTLSIV